MKSLRSQLTFALALAICMLLGAGGLGIFFVTRGVMVDQFDDTLVAKATALITATEIDDEEFEIDLTVQDFAGFGPGGDDYFEIRRGNGRAMVISPSLGERENNLIPHSGLTLKDEARLVSGQLGDGRAARFYIQSFVPKDDEKREYRDLYLVAASPTRELSRNLWILGSVIAAVGGLLLLAVIPLLRLVLGRGLKPLDDLSRQVIGISDNQLDRRLDLAGLPEELLPLGSSLNAWLGRMEGSFERERRFSSHAAHELRTPLCELKMIAELGSSWEDQATPARFREVIAIVDEMELLLEKLAMLARADAGSLPVVLEDVDLKASVGAAVERVEQAARARRIRVESSVVDGMLRTDAVLWTAIVQNLIGNAVSHAPEGSVVEVDASPGCLVVSNPAPDLRDEDMEKVFDRFWRKDTSHGGEAHSGLGLSIVKACTGLLGGRCRLSLDEEKRFRAEVVWDQAAQ